MAQRMPVPLTVSCLSKIIQISFSFLVPAHPGSPGQRDIKQVCVCVSTCMTCHKPLRSKILHSFHHLVVKWLPGIYSGGQLFMMDDPHYFFAVMTPVWCLQKTLRITAQQTTNADSISYCQFLQFNELTSFRCLPGVPRRKTAFRIKQGDFASTWMTWKDVGALSSFSWSL